MPHVTALLLAAGLSRRMAPANKLLLRDREGVTMVGRVAMACASSGATSLVTVLGHQADAVKRAVREALPSPGPRFVRAASYESGLSASLRAGIAAVPAESEGALVCLGDMPLVSGAAMGQIIAAFAPGEGRHAIVPKWKGRRGNPVLWGRRFFPPISGLSGDSGAKALLERFADQVCEVEAESEAVLSDFDTEAALEGWGGYEACGRGEADG